MFTLSVKNSTDNKIEIPLLVLVLNCIGARWMVRNEPGNSSGVHEFMGHPICALNLADVGCDFREEKIKPQVVNAFLSDGSLTFSPVWCEV